LPTERTYFTKRACRNSFQDTGDRSPSSRLERLVCCAAALAVIGLGLVWRSRVLPFSPFVRKYGADALWAALVFLLIRFLSPRMRIWSSAWIAFAVSAAVEFSQLYHAGWIDSIRATRLGGLILGSVFNWPDFAAYTFGIIPAALIAGFLRRMLRTSTP
jgi:hypothetical protein